MTHCFSLNLQSTKKYLCKCSFLEIYQEQVFDLLDTNTTNLQLREGIKRGVFVDGLTEHVVTTPVEAYEVRSCSFSICKSI